MTEWIKIKTRPLTQEERGRFGKHVEFMYDCELPEDGQEVLVTTWLGNVDTDIFCRDSDDSCYFEAYCGENDVVAWMPLPEPFEDEGEE